MGFASTLAAAGRDAECESVLREAMTIEPDDPAPHHALLELILRDGRDVEAFAFCAAMLARFAAPTDETLRRGARAMLTLHERHARLLLTREEPDRLHTGVSGAWDPTPMMLAPEFLKRARTLARQAVARAPRRSDGHLLLAECELRAGNSTAARMSAERAVDFARGDERSHALLAQAIAAFADHREGRALELLRAPRLTEWHPSLGTGAIVTADVDPTFAPTSIATDPNRRETIVPYGVMRQGHRRGGEVALRTAPPVLTSIRRGRVVGGEWIAVTSDDRALVHGVAIHPPRGLRPTELATALGTERNLTLWCDDDRILLHSPRLEREFLGRAVLLGAADRCDLSTWLLDCLGRLAAVPSLLTDPDVRFVVPDTLPAAQIRSLAWLGIAPDRLAAVGSDEVVAFDELIVVRQGSHGGCVAPETVAWLRDALTVPRLCGEAIPHRRLFVRSAGRSATRLLLNEPEVERICTSLGFESVDAERMPIAEQRDLFADAACIVSPDQPALANLLFAPAGAKAIILAPRSFARARHAALAHALEQRATFVLGAERPTRATYPDWEYAVDPADLEGALRQELRQAFR